MPSLDLLYWRYRLRDYSEFAELVTAWSVGVGARLLGELFDRANESALVNEAEFTRHLAQDLRSGAISELLELVEKHGPLLTTTLERVPDALGRAEAIDPVRGYEAFLFRGAALCAIGSIEQTGGSINSMALLDLATDLASGWLSPQDFGCTVIVHEPRYAATNVGYLQPTTFDYYHSEDEADADGELEEITTFDAGRYLVENAAGASGRERSA